MHELLKRVTGIILLAGLKYGSLLTTPPCYECMLRSEVRHPERIQLSTACPTKCDCPGVPSPDTKPVCSPGVSIIRDGCGCCWICARQSGESCSLRYKCDSAENLHCFYESNSTAFSEGWSPHVVSRKQLTLIPSRGGDVGVCWKHNGRSCYFNNTWLAHSGVQKSGCRHQCVCVDGTLLCTDLCLQQELQRPPDSICELAIGDSGETRQLKLMPPGPGECCRRWMCITVINADRVDEDIQQIGASSNSVVKHAQCNNDTRETSPWSICSQQCGLGFSVRWTTETYDCQNTTQFRLCFWRPCEKVKIDSSKQFVPTLKFIRPAFLKFTALNGDPTNLTLLNEIRSLTNGSSKSGTSKQVICQLSRAFRPRFCNWPRNPGECCWPSHVKTKRLRFNCSGGKIVYQFFEWIQMCRCTSAPCEALFTNTALDVGDNSL